MDTLSKPSRWRHAVPITGLLLIAAGVTLVAGLMPGCAKVDDWATAPADNGPPLFTPEGERVDADRQTRLEKGGDAVAAAANFLPPPWNVIVSVVATAGVTWFGAGAVARKRQRAASSTGTTATAPRA